jgi:hypothetical protein
MVQCLLLVPKYLARHKMDYDPLAYYRRYLAPYLEGREIDAATELVCTLKNGRVQVDRSKLYEKYPPSASAIARWTLEYPQALERYRDLTVRRTREPLDHSEVATWTGSPRPNFQALLDSVRAVSVGPAGATLYHRAVRDLLAALFYPALINPVIEKEIHEGRKRVDIVFENVATRGFFDWLGRHYRAPLIFVECKNYSADPANPELDQLAGRFGPRRGKFGLLVCRKIKGKSLFAERCRDTAHDDRGFIVALDDDDLQALVEIATESHGVATSELLNFHLLRERFDKLIL